MQANAASFPLPSSPARRARTQGTAMSVLMAASMQVYAGDTIEAPVESDETTQNTATEEPWSLRHQPAQSLIGRIDLASASPSHVPTLSLERSRLLPANQTWPGSNGVDSFGRPFTEMGGVSYRWWLRRGRADVGVGFGTMGYLVPPPEGNAAGPHSLVYVGPHALAYAGPHTLAHSAATVTVGVRYQVGDHSTLYADALGARRSYADSRSELYGTKVGMEWKDKATSRFGFEKGALGVRFDSGLRMSLRARKGGVGLYLRGQF